MRAPTAPTCKVANLENMLEAARHDLLVLADSDMRVDRHYLGAVTAPLHDPAHRRRDLPLQGCARPAGCGPSSGRCTSISAFSRARWSAESLGLGGGLLWRDDRAAPRDLRAHRRICAGCGTSSPTTTGSATRSAPSGSPSCCRLISSRLGCPSQSFADLWRHELRWARTVRAVAPAGFAGSVLAHPVAIAALAAAADGIWLDRLRSFL